MQPDIAALLKFVQFKTSRSGGKGGQHVNKVETKVELLLNINACEALSDKQKQIIQKKLKHKITQEGILHLVSQSERSQLLNKERTVKELKKLIQKAFQPVKARKATQPTLASKVARLKAKQHQSEKKKYRKISRNNFSD